MDLFVQSAGSGLATAEEKKQMAECVAKWIASSSRPFRSVEDDGLAEVIELAMRIA